MPKSETENYPLCNNNNNNNSNNINNNAIVIIISIYLFIELNDALNIDISRHSLSNTNFTIFFLDTNIKIKINSSLYIYIYIYIYKEEYILHPRYGKSRVLFCIRIVPTHLLTFYNVIICGISDNFFPRLTSAVCLRWSVCCFAPLVSSAHGGRRSAQLVWIRRCRRRR